MAYRQGPSRAAPRVLLDGRNRCDQHVSVRRQCRIHRRTLRALSRRPGQRWTRAGGDFFADLGDDAAALRAERAGPPWAPAPKTNGAARPLSPAPTADDSRQAALDSIRALQLIRAYRVRGHLQADLDPLGLEQRGFTPSSTTAPTASPRPISTARSSSTTPRPRARHLARDHRRCCARSIAAASASNTCTSRCSTSASGSSRNSRTRDRRPTLTNAARKESCGS